MEILIKSLIVLHVIAGFGALGFGMGAIVSQKGRKAHLFTGRTFFYLMMLVAVSAGIVSLMKLNVFLLLIAGFSLYQTIGGYRSVKNKSLRPNWIDWSATALGLITAIFMLLTVNIVMIVFGSICLSLVLLDLRIFFTIYSGKALSKLGWLARHIGFMMGAYIATFTAFVVVNVRNVEPAWLPWLAPTAIGVPLMQYWTWKYTRAKNIKSLT